MAGPDSDKNPELEGIPLIDEQPPGIDLETAQEAEFVPRDHTIAAGSDPAYPVTAAEQRVPESVAERASREQPDVAVADDESMALFEPDSDVEEIDLTAEEVAVRGDEPGLPVSAEEAAMHVIDEGDQRAV